VGCPETLVTMMLRLGTDVLGPVGCPETLVTLMLR
jgi:hypothetical protein